MARLQTRADELEALAELRAQIRREALDRQTPVLGLAILAFHLGIMLGGIAVFVAGDVLWLRVIALLISTYGALGIGMTGHNASHYGVTGWKRVDRALTYLTMTVLNGISATYWRHKHIRLHHSAPNNIGHDTDIDLLPFFALNEDEVRAARGWRRQLYRVQHWVFPFAIGVNMMNLQIAGLFHIRQEMRRHGRRGREHNVAVEHFAQQIKADDRRNRPDQRRQDQKQRDMQGKTGQIGPQRHALPPTPAHFPAYVDEPRDFQVQHVGADGNGKHPMLDAI